MSYVIDGVLSGLLMASVFVAVAPIMVFHLATEPSPFFEGLLARVSPMRMMMGLAVLAFPVWMLIGAVVGALFGLSAAEEPDGVDLVYTLVIVAVALSVGAPLAALLRRVLVGVVALTLLFMGIFGGLLPLLAR